MLPNTLPRPTEAECRRTIIAAAMLAGWLVHGQRPGVAHGRWASQIDGHPGVPDLIMVRDGRLLAIELKRKPNVLEPAQAKWLNELRKAGIDARLVWVPDNMQELIDELVRP